MKAFRLGITLLALVSCVLPCFSFLPPAIGRAFSLERTFIGARPLASSLVEEEETVLPVKERTSRILADDKDFVKPLPDKRQYRALELENGLEVLVVSSPDSDVEAGAVHVQAGHLDDVIPGLAHFHEHMLFLGTEKYPATGDYDSFLATHGGHSNAYTDMEDTNYYFSVTPSTEASTDKVSLALQGALDRFAQFFIAPLFDEDMVDRELSAVDSEYRNSLSSDAWRNFQLLKNASNPIHPFSKFGCGNYDTLTQNGSSPRSALLEFWKTYYQTYNMRLCVVGRSSLDALQECVEETFGNLPSSTTTAKRRRGKVLEKPVTEFPSEHAQYSPDEAHIVQAFSQKNLGRIRETKPLRESRSVKIHFAAPPLDDVLLKQSRPYRVLSHLLGHESPGSLYVLLNQEGYLTGLTSGIGVDTSDFSLFTLTLALTPKGMSHWEKVVDHIFEWISLIRNLPDDTLHAYHDELRQISNYNFRFRENGDPTDFCSSAAELLFDYEPSQLLVGTSQSGEYDPSVGHAFMDRLRSENALISIVNSDINMDDEEEWRTEPWYGAQFRDTNMTPEQLERWSNPTNIDSRLQLPALNEYIPTDFSLQCDKLADSKAEPEESMELEPPKLILNNGLRMWHKLDRYWRVPKTYIRLSLLSPNVYQSPRTMTLNRLYQRVLNDDLNSFVYDASMAGCNYRVDAIPSGYRISVKGFSEKLPLLLDTLTSRMLSLLEEMKDGSDPALALKFKKAVDGLLRETKNFRQDSAYEVANYNARLIMEESVWYIQNYIDEMEGPIAEKNPLTMQECAHVAEECLRGRLKAEAMCIGNINEEEAMKVAGVIEDHFLKESSPLSDVETPLFRSKMLPTRSEAVSILGPEAAAKRIPLVYQELAFSESEENNAAEVTLQAGCELDMGYEGIAIIDLISHIAYTSAYNRLRTELQLGYIVSASARKTAGGAWSLSIVVQSSTTEPLALQEHIEDWLVMFRGELEKMDAQKIADEGGAVVAQLMERDTKLSQEVNRVWQEIMMTEPLSDHISVPQFDRIDRIADELIVSDGKVEADEVAMNGQKRRSAVELKDKVLRFFDKHFAADSPDRRAMSSLVYNQNSKAAFDEEASKPGVFSDKSDIAHLKQYLSSWPTAPYWIPQQKER